MAERADEAIYALMHSERPEQKGIIKKGCRKGCFAWELGRSCRILYRPNHVQRIIDFLRVCSHKEVYGP